MEIEFKESVNRDGVWNIYKDGVHIAMIFTECRTKTTKFLGWFHCTVKVAEYDLYYTMNPNLAPPHVSGLRSYEQAKQQVMKHRLEGYLQ